VTESSVIDELNAARTVTTHFFIVTWEVQLL